jgi:hypothetical protein
LFVDDAAAMNVDVLDTSTTEGSAEDADGDRAVADAADAEAESADADAATDVWTGPPSDGGCQLDAGNLITNADFSQGTTDWGVVYMTAGMVTLVTDAGPYALCLVAPANQTSGLAWLRGAPLTCSSYVFSYSARASQASVDVTATVGHSTPPYTQDYSNSAAPDNVTTSWTTYTHLPVDGGDMSAGLSFEFYSTVAQEVCFEAVSLTPNPTSD